MRFWNTNRLLLPTTTILVWLIFVGAFYRMDKGGFRLEELVNSREDELAHAIETGDIELARNIYESRRVLGYTQDSIIESILYPERVINANIQAYLKLLEAYPGSRDIYLQLAILYDMKGSEISAKKYLGLAYQLDPNGDKVKTVSEIINK